jgi:hypothetical protein
MSVTRFFVQRTKVWALEAARRRRALQRHHCLRCEADIETTFAAGPEGRPGAAIVINEL